MVPFTEVPILDISLASDPATKPAFLQDLQNALLGVGFMYIKNTGIDDALTDKLVNLTKAFFELPQEEKSRIEMKNCIPSSSGCLLLRVALTNMLQLPTSSDTRGLAMRCLFQGSFGVGSRAQLTAGCSTKQATDWREQIDLATELPAPGYGEPTYRNLRGPNQWPSEELIPGFRETVEEYISQMSELSTGFTSLVSLLSR